MRGEAPDEYVRRLSSEKAAAVAKTVATVEPTLVLAADTTVELDGNILGKPESKDHGISMLEALSGRQHGVLTGVTVLGDGVERTFSVFSAVSFRPLQRPELEWYWNTGEPLDKAGSYGLQGVGAVFVDSITGSYSNVIGLPLSETVSVLRELGMSVLGVDVK